MKKTPLNLINDLITIIKTKTPNEESKNDNFSIKSNKSNKLDPNKLILPKTPKLHIAKVKLPWNNESIPMKILPFYHSKPHIFGCQFSNLFYSPIKLNTKHIIQTNDKSIQTIWNHEKINLKHSNNPNIQEFKSSENVFQSAKAQNKTDALFVQSLSPGDSARAGQARLKMNKKLANKYKQFGGTPYKMDDNSWQFSQNNKRYMVRNNWHSYKMDIMYYALKIKFNTYYNLISEYINSDIPIFLIEHTINDTQWGDGNNGYGTNYLGKMLTILLWEFKWNKNCVNQNKFKINILNDNIQKWFKLNNISIIQNGKEFYQNLLNT